MTGRGWLLFTIACIVVIGTLVLAWPAHSRDIGQWGASDPGLKQWYEHN